MSKNKQGFELQPLGSRILVKLDDEQLDSEYEKREHEGRTIVVRKESGLQVPDTIAEEFLRMPVTGTVVATGDALRWPLTKGTRVMFGQWAGCFAPPRCGYEDHKLMDEQDVICMLTEV